MSLSRRIVLALFCFIAFYWRENHEKSGELFFFLGVAILMISVLLVFILHFETKVQNKSIILDGLWPSRKVKIDLGSIRSVAKVKYSKYMVKYCIYNNDERSTSRFLRYKFRKL